MRTKLNVSRFLTESIARVIAIPVLLALFAVPLRAQALATAAPKYTGPGACSSPSCHGSVSTRNSSVLQNEYSTWAVKDKHSRAAAALTSETAKRIGRILFVNPETSDKCLDCHVLNAKTTERAKTFEQGDGVSCESCHGPASEWLGPHTTQGWTHGQSVAKGMSDVRDPVKYSEACLSCHLGTSTKWVDHQMIAAGHPDLYFELASFSEAMPRHWKDRDGDLWFGVRVTVAGQIVQLRESLRRIAAETTRFWPEFSELDCFACHHSIGARSAWRQERGYHGRRPGSPPWNMSPFASLRLILDQLDPASARKLDISIGKVNALVSDIGADRRTVAADAEAAARIADEVAERSSGYRYDAETVLALIKHFDFSAAWIAGQGERAAEQSAMVLNSLIGEYARHTKPARPIDPQLTAALASLFQVLENPSGYTPLLFEARLHAVAKLVPTHSSATGF